MLNRYYFDVPFYARLREPVAVVTDWANPDIRLSDSWSKELADAGRFAPERAATTLLALTALPAALCGTRTSWLIGSPASVSQFPFLARARTVRTEHDMTLWRIDASDTVMASALACAAQPNVAPAT